METPFYNGLEKCWRLEPTAGHALTGLNPAVKSKANFSAIDGKTTTFMQTTKHLYAPLQMLRLSSELSPRQKHKSSSRDGRYCGVVGDPTLDTDHNHLKVWKVFREIRHNSVGIPAIPFKEPLPAYAPSIQLSSPSIQLSSGSITFDLNVTMP
jgi:hypothetical protein